MNLKDKKVVVTGGSRGLGLGLVEALVAHGAKVTALPAMAMRWPPFTPGSTSL
jgi:NAD(P)-dependent dehydrogenase (short-subunit alcohol dehydrogenase family)